MPASSAQLMQEGSKLQGLHVIRLLQWFVLPPDERDTYEYASYVLANIAQVCGSPSLCLEQPLTVGSCNLDAIC